MKDPLILMYFSIFLLFMFILYSIFRLRKMAIMLFDIPPVTNLAKILQGDQIYRKNKKYFYEFYLYIFRC